MVFDGGVKNMSKPVLILDFDGVLFDTVYEAYAVASLAIKAVDSLSDLSWGDEWSLFHKFRYLVGPAWNYLPLFKAIRKVDEVVEEQVADLYGEYCSTIDEKEREYFEKRFFAARSELKKHHYKEWLSLNKAYPFLHALQKLGVDELLQVYIVTTKDRETVLDLLCLEGWDFSPDNIYDRNSFNMYGSKGEIIKFLLSDVKRDALFIDDHCEHLASASGIGITGLSTVLAAWGYSSACDRGVSPGEVIHEIERMLRKG